MPLIGTRGAASAQGFGEFAQQAAVAAPANAIDFDGTNDYLSRDGDLTGNTNGKTFTFSAWVWLDGANSAIYSSDTNGGGNHFNVLYVSSTLQLRAYSSGGALAASADITGLPIRTFFNILISVDCATGAGAIYINDEYVDVPATSNYTIQFTGAFQLVGLRYVDYPAKARLSNVFLDYTYRDLSVTANRRLFITADRKPASGQAALNPIVYLPISSPTTPGTNSGTGGNFTLNGVVARSGRGPNQYNAPYSNLNGTSQYLSRTTAPTGIADGKQFTVAFSIRPNALALHTVTQFATAGAFRFEISYNSSGDLDVFARNSANTDILSASLGGAFKVNRNYVVVVSVDLSDTGKRHVYINGTSQSGLISWGTYTNDSIQFSISSTPTYRVGNNAANTKYVSGSLGAFWFNTSYIDLSVAANLAKFVTGTGIDAKPVDLGATGQLPTGTSPLIYLPMYGNNAGKNYGTGGDFTVNAGPYTGARGPNEFWGNKAQFDGSTGYLARDTGITGLASSKTFSMSFWCSPDVSGTSMRVISGNAGGTDNRLNIIRQTTNDLAIAAKNSSGTIILEGYTTAVFTAGASCYVQIAIDMSSTAKRFVYINGVANSVTWLTYTDDVIDFTPLYWTIGASYFNGSRNLFFNGKISEFYFTTDYIDFSQEANRLLFRDCFGNPTDLPSAITALTVPNPAIYMRFPPTSFGTNSGTGGNFTANGTITDGGQL